MMTTKNLLVSLKIAVSLIILDFLIYIYNLLNPILPKLLNYGISKGSGEFF